MDSVIIGPDDVRAPIGVYDSGVGGISVLRALQATLPHERYVYVADSGHAPYGEQPQKFLDERAHAVTAFLVRQRIKALVLACNTVSVAAARSLRATYSLPIVAMEPAIKPAALATRSRVVLVLATTNTIESQAVARLCRLYGGEARIILQACPGLVERVEQGQIATTATRELLATYLRPGLVAGADTIVLGCTHYPFLVDEIAKIAGAGVSVIEPSAAIARQLQRLLPNPAATDAPLAPPVFHTSGDVARLRAFLATIGQAHSGVQQL
jgi:glutamate racemase